MLARTQGTWSFIGSQVLAKCLWTVTSKEDSSWCSFYNGLWFPYFSASPSSVFLSKPSQPIYHSVYDNFIFIHLCWKQYWIEFKIKVVISYAINSHTTSSKEKNTCLETTKYVYNIHQNSFLYSCNSHIQGFKIKF